MAVMVVQALRATASLLFVLRGHIAEDVKQKKKKGVANAPDRADPIKVAESFDKSIAYSFSHRFEVRQAATIKALRLSLKRVRDFHLITRVSRWKSVRAVCPILCGAHLRFGESAFCCRDAAAAGRD